MTTGNYILEARPVLEAALSDNDRLRQANGRLTQKGAEQRRQVERLEGEMRQYERSKRELHLAHARLETLSQELEEVSAALVKAKQEFGHLAKAASHDLRAPMRTMGQFVQLLMERVNADAEPKQQQYLEHILDGSERMSALMCDLLTYSRVVTAQLRIAPVNLNPVFQYLRGDFLGELRKTKGEIQTEGTLPTIRGDPNQIEQLFQILVSNALRFRSTWPPRICVTSERVDQGWAVSVSDNGIGIDPRYHERIFRIFQRLHTRDEYPGTGMGLAIAARIAEHHRGSISVDSSLGQGATFRVTFPDEQAG